MNFICDLHIHSRFSGGCSNHITVFQIAENSRIKGINIVGTGDCLHPLWLEEIKKELIEYSNGIYYIRQIPEVKFILQTEIEVIWKYKQQLKKVHFIVLIPDFNVLDEIINVLSKHGNLKLDGRPKIYCSPEKLIFTLISIDDMIEIIPAHIFTPYFGILGEKSKFHSIREALGDSMNQIHSIETGLSADPPMVRCISELNNFSILSFSDSHSLIFHRLGREAAEVKLSNLNYKNLIDVIRRNKIKKTYEFKPSAGRYFYDGCRPDHHNNEVDYFCSPSRQIDICPYCGKRLTRGVLSRIYELKDQELPLIKENYQYIVPLLELIKFIRGGTQYSKENLTMYLKLTQENGGEYNIWNGNSNFKGIPEEIINAIYKIRTGKYYFIPGHDGCYGKLKLES